MTTWTYCVKAIPEYADLVTLARHINYHKRRMWAIRSEPGTYGYDVFTAQEAIDSHIEVAEELSNEYRYMIMMHIGGGRIV